MLVTLKVVIEIFKIYFYVVFLMVQLGKIKDASKIPEFWGKISIWTAHHTFLEIQHPKDTENPY